MSLNRSRIVDWTPHPLQISEIEAWLRLNDIEDSEEKQNYAFFIRGLDFAWLAWAHNEMKNKGKNNANT